MAVGIFYLLISFACLGYSVYDFTQSHPLRSIILVSISMLLFVCSLGLLRSSRGTVLVFTLFWINAGVAYVTAGITRLGIDYRVVMGVLVLLVPYYVIVFQHKLYKAPPNKAL